MTKWIIGFGVVVIVGVALWWSGVFSSFMSGKPAPEEQATTTPQQTQSPAPVSDLPTQNNDASDAAMVQDTAAVDLQLKSLSTDAANVDASINDKPVTQEF